MSGRRDGGGRLGTPPPRYHGGHPCGGLAFPGSGGFPPPGTGGGPPPTGSWVPPVAAIPGRPQSGHPLPRARRYRWMRRVAAVRAESAHFAHDAACSTGSAAAPDAGASPGTSCGRWVVLGDQAADELLACPPEPGERPGGYCLLCETQQDGSPLVFPAGTADLELIPCTRHVSRPNRQPATGLPGDYPDRTYTGRRRRASDQAMIAGQPPP
jgi:hypothetical protein